MIDEQVTKVLSVLEAAYPAVRRPDDATRFLRTKLSGYEYQQTIKAVMHLVDNEERWPAWSKIRDAIEAEGRSPAHHAERTSPFDSARLSGGPTCPLCASDEYVEGYHEAIVRDAHYWCAGCSTVFVGHEGEWEAMRQMRETFRDRRAKALEIAEKRQA